MVVPYKSRLMALIGSDLIELVRFRRAVTSADIRFYTRGLSCPWRQEKTLRNDETITARWMPPISHEAHRQRAAHALAHKK